MLITLGVEDDLSEAVARRLISQYAPDLAVADTVGFQGKVRLRQRLRDLNNIARNQWPVLVITDLDRPRSCPPALLQEWRQEQSLASALLIRVAVLEIEAWLLADRIGAARWLAIAGNLIPLDPESILDPKRALIELANRSRNRELRSAIVPRRGIGTDRTGPGYNGAVGEFASHRWNPEAARSNAPSLDRAIIRIGELALHRQP